MSSIKSNLFRAGRALSKASSVLADIDIVTSGDKKKIAKRVANKVKNKALYDMQKKTNIK